MIPTLAADPTRTHLYAMFAEIAERVAKFIGGETTFAPLDVGGHQQSRMSALAAQLGLGGAETALLACAVAPSVDSRIGQLFASQDLPAARSSATVGLAFTICGLSLWEPADREVVASDARLSRARLWTVEGSGPLPTRTLIVHERLVAHLLGDDTVDHRLGADATPVAAVDTPEVERMARLIGSGATLVWIHDHSGHSGGSVAATALASLGTTRD